MLSDALNFLGKMSLLKLWNIMMVRSSYLLSVLLKKPLVWGRPWFVSIEPASVCNLACPQCPTGKGDVKRSKSFMNPGEYRDLLEEISATTAMLSLYFQGEPLMHTQFSGFVRLAADHNIYTQTSTNGQLLGEDVCRGLVDGGLDRIIISLDGTDRESYQTYRRGGDISKVEEGIRTLDRLRREAGSRKPYIIVQFLVFKHNQDQIQEVKKLAKKWGADRVWIKSAQIEYPDRAGDWIPDGFEYSRYEKSPSGEWRLRGRLRNRCIRLWQTTVITSDGFVVPCCFDKLAAYTMGKTGEQDMAQIWKNRSYTEFRRQVLIDRKETVICTNCTEGIGKI